MATADEIRATVRAYVDLVATGPTAAIVDLYAPDARVEDPVGTNVHVGAEAIHAFYTVLEHSDSRESELLTLRVSGNRAAFHFRLVTKLGENSFEITPIDVMEFDEAGKIVAMQAYWGQDDIKVG